MNTALFLLRAKQIGLSLSEMDQMEEGEIVNMIIESGNDSCTDEYAIVAGQEQFDRF